MHQTSFWGTRNIVHEDDSVAITLKRNELNVYVSLKGNKLICFANYLRLILRTGFVFSLFVISEKSIKRCTFFFIVHAWHQKSQQSTRKKCAPEFLILSALKLPSCGLLVFKKYEHLYTYRRYKFKNILERKIFNCLGLL